MGKNKHAVRNAVITTAIISILASGIIGGLLGAYLAPNTDTRVKITIDPGFGVIYGGVLNASCNCSRMELEAFSFSWSVYNAITAFFAANKTKMLGMNNITSETGLEDYIMGNAYYYMGNSSIIYWWPTNTTKMEGMSNTFSLGHVAAEPEIEIGSFINGSYESDYFMPNATVTMDDALYDGNLTASVWNAAWMLKSFNSVIITSWNYDQYTLNVIVDGVSTTWEEY
jgi:hypothetical protein